MFTGIITDIGDVLELEQKGDLRARIGTRYDVDGIDIVATDNIFNNRTDKLSTFGQSRIKKILFVVGDKPFRMFIIDMRIGESSHSNCSGTIRVHPGMKLHISFVTFVNQECH